MRAVPCCHLGMVLPSFGFIGLLPAPRGEPHARIPVKVCDGQRQSSRLPYECLFHTLSAGNLTAKQAAGAPLAAAASLAHRLCCAGRWRSGGLAPASLADCEFNRAFAEGLLICCSARINRLTGLALGTRPAVDCTGCSNRSLGIVTLTAAGDCRATDNIGICITAKSVTARETKRNGAIGIMATSAVT